MIFKNINRSILLLVVYMCSFNTSCKPSEDLSTAEVEMQLSNLEALLQNESFQIDINTVLPFNTTASQAVLNSVLLNRNGDTPNRINVGGEGYSLVFKDRIVKAYLPFYGEQRFARGAYVGNTSGISLDSKPKDLTITKHKKKAAYILKFTIKDSEYHLESYDVVMTISTGKLANISITSSHRTNINYLGRLKPVE